LADRQTVWVVHDDYSWWSIFLWFSVYLYGPYNRIIFYIL
jgi:hypothetical protein